jgi:hypothetical protein
MRKLIIIIAAMTFTTPAFADAVAHIKNKAGGKIVLTDESCESNPDMKRSYFYTKKHYTEEGCWINDELTVLVDWEKMGRHRYDKKSSVLKSRWKLVNRW